MKIILLRGLAASGKTTLMNKIKSEYPEYSLWSKDTLFDQLLNENVEWDLANKKTYNHLFELIKNNKDTDHKLIIDAPYYRESEYSKLKEFCENQNVLFTSVLVTCSSETEWRNRFKERSKNPKPNQTITDYDEIKNYYGSMYVESVVDEFIFDSCDQSPKQYKNLISYIRSW